MKAKIKITHEFQKSGLNPIELLGIVPETEALSCELSENEIIVKASVGTIDKKSGLFILTTDRVLFLQRTSKNAAILKPTIAML